MELSQILEWQKYLLFAHKIVYSMEWPWSEVLEWSGVRFKMECSCDVCVCVCVWPSFMPPSGCIFFLPRVQTRYYY